MTGACTRQDATRATPIPGDAAPARRADADVRPAPIGARSSCAEGVSPCPAAPGVVGPSVPSQSHDGGARPTGPGAAVVGDGCDAHGMEPFDPDRIAEDDGGADDIDLTIQGRDQDAVAALRDTEAEAGDEDELDDLYDMDDREARQLGVDLDDRDEPEPRLD